MDIGNVRRSIQFGFLIFIMLSVNTFSQSSPPGTEKSPVEIQNEPRHHLKFENKFVRIWDALIPAGGATLWHIHSKDNVVLTLSDAHVRIETVGAAPVETQAKAGDVAFRKAPYVHRTMSIGATPFHNIAIEILASHNSGNSSQTKAETGQTAVIDNERVRVYKISIGPGESTGMQTLPAASLQVALTPGRIETVKKDESKPVQKSISAGDLTWRENDVTRSIKNVGTTRFEAVDIELK